MDPVWIACRATDDRYQAGFLLASFPGRRRDGLATSASSNCYFRCLKVSSTDQISERSHMTTVKSNCVMHWTVAVTPIPLQQRSLDCASVGTLHDNLSSNDFYFTSVVELTANSCFHEQESPILAAGKIVSITCARLWNEILRLPWRRGSCQAISPMAWEQGWVSTL